jgi:hypothetical protein
MIETNLMERNLVIIGGGPGGYVAAIRAAQVGIRATIISPICDTSNKPATFLTASCSGIIPLYSTGIPIVAEDVGSNFGRTVYFSLDTGTMRVQSLNRNVCEF